MKLGKIKNFVLSFILLLAGTLTTFAENKIETVPLINLDF